MPFNWNVSRINNTSIFVHEEVTVPKANAFTTKGSFIGKVNGIDISKDVVVDNSNAEKDVIHVMIPIISCNIFLHSLRHMDPIRLWFF
jgi:hypothetical protein